MLWVECSWGGVFLGWRGEERGLFLGFVVGAIYNIVGGIYFNTTMEIGESRPFCVGGHGYL